MTLEAEWKAMIDPAVIAAVAASAANQRRPSDEPATSVGSHAELTGRLAETIGADPALTQGIRIDVNVHKDPTVTVTRLADADQIGRIIQCSTWADYTLVENDELKRLRLTDDQIEAILYCVSCAQDYRDTLDCCDQPEQYDRATQMIEAAMRLAMPTKNVS
jgi:hypothetical protein